MKIKDGILIIYKGTTEIHIKPSEIIEISELTCVSQLPTVLDCYFKVRTTEGRVAVMCESLRQGRERIACIQRQILETDIKSCRVYKKTTLSSGKGSDIYFDLRPLFLKSHFDASLLLEFLNIPEDTSKILCAQGFGGVSILLALKRWIIFDALLIRDEQKTHGTSRQIEGDYCGGDVIIVDDVITTGDSLLNTINICNENNIPVSAVRVVIDRQEGGLERVRDVIKDTKAIFTLEELI